MTNRRNFIKSASALALGTLGLSAIPSFGAPKRTPYGLILYTVRDEMKNDPVKTLEQVASIGYEVVEAAGYSDGKIYGMAPAEFKRRVESFGMKLISSHTGVTMENINQVIEDAQKAGLKYVVKPSLHARTADEYKKGAEEFNKFGELFNSAGIKFGYHNHSFEFKKTKGQIPYDILLKETDPKLVTFEMDLLWITKGGHDPWEYFAKYPGRFQLWHLKDMEGTGKKEMTAVGNGVIDFDRIFSESKQAGMKYSFVEQDTCKNHTPLESIKISLDHIKKKRF